MRRGAASAVAAWAQPSGRFAGGDEITEVFEDAMWALMRRATKVAVTHKASVSSNLPEDSTVPVAGALLHGDGNGGGGGGQRREQRRCELVAGRVGIAIAHALRRRYPSATILAKPLLHAPEAPCD